MICKNCGAHFDDNLPKCPYCGEFHYAGARKDYMGKKEAFPVADEYYKAEDYDGLLSFYHTSIEQNENALEYLCEALDYHYEYLEREPYGWLYESGAYDERHLDAVNRITEKIENLLQITFSITEEEMAAFKEFSSAEKQVFIERRFEEHE